jgi:hypothetical protein
MIHYNDNEDISGKSIVNGMGILLMGVIMGATAVLLSKRENRTMIMEKINKLMDVGEETMRQVKTNAEKVKEGIKRKIDENTDMADMPKIQK